MIMASKVVCVNLTERKRQGVSGHLYAFSVIVPF